MSSRPRYVLPLTALFIASAACAGGESSNTVRATVQIRPGGPVEEIEMEVHEVPVDPPTVAADEIELRDDELVVGVVLDGQAVAYPVRYLALSEVVNDRVGETAIAPSW